MTDELLLEQKIKESGKSKGYLAEKLGITVQTLRLKITNHTAFYVHEVDKLCTELNITKLTEKEKIFYKK